MTPTKTFLEQTGEYFNSARFNLVAGASGLFKIKNEELWKDSYDSFAAYLEDIGVSQGMASKLIATYQYYVLDGGLDQSKLVSIDHEKLYLALKLPGNAEKKFHSALTLSRQELRQEVRDPDDICEHNETIMICANCHKKM